MSVVVDCTRRQSGRKALVVQPFAQLPHHIACDPRLSPTDVRVLLALVFFAKAKSACYPGDAALAARVGRSIPTVQRSLRHLQGLGYIDRRPVTTNPTNRVIVLCWRPSPTPITDDRPPRSPMIDPPRSPMIEEGNKTPGTDEMIVVFLGNGLTLHFAAGELGPVPLGHGSLVTSNFAGVMREG